MSEDEGKPPADDAPIEELIIYFDSRLAPKPSDKVRQRLLEACEDRPERFLYLEISSLMDCLPENADTHDRLYKLLNEEPEGKRSWKHNLQTWLRRNTAYFRDDLIKRTQRADDIEYDDIGDLRALARLDWNAARPILETLASAGKAFVTPLALTLLYEHAAQEGDSALTESYRALLKAIVAHRQANWNARVETLASLMNTDRLFERAKALRATEPTVAREILSGIEFAPLRAAGINLVERIGDGAVDAFSIAQALKDRDALRKSAGDELYGLIKQGGYAAGIAATVLNDERVWRATLESGDAKAQLSLLACARLLCDKLPVQLVGSLLNSPNRALAKAAESYLEVEDSPESRKLVLARHPGEAYILGDITTISDEYGNTETVRRWEDALRKEAQGRDGLEAIYAVARIGKTAKDFTGVIIRVRGGKAEVSVHETQGRRNVRRLTESEFEELKSFTSRQEVEDLGPESYAEAGSLVYEYLRLTKDGGRRIKLDGLRRAPKNPALHEELSGLVYRLSRSGEFTTRYAIEDKIPNVEVLLADKKQEAMIVCGEGREIRVLIWEKGAEYKRSIAEAIPEWREFSSGKPGKVSDDPSACRVLGMIPTLMKNRGSNHYREISLPTAFGGAWVYVSYGEDPGIWKLEPGADPAKIVSGSYMHPVLTPDGKWLVAIKSVSEAGDPSSQLIRHNLQTGKEFPINIANSGYHPPATYVAAHGKVLLGIIGPHGEPLPGPMNYLLDTETGTVQQVKGEFRPLTERFGRELQPTGNPNEFWAVVHDWNKRVTRFGRYDSKNFAFTPLLELPGLILRNNEFWVDATAGKIWLTYRGHLLRIPLPAKPK